MTNDEIKLMLDEYKVAETDDKQEMAYRLWLNSPEKPNDFVMGLIYDTLRAYPIQELAAMWKRCDNKSPKMRLLKHQIGEVLEARIGV